MTDRSADAAIKLLDKLLDERPDRVGEDFSEATRWIVAYRDELIAEWRRTATDGDRRRLDKTNAVLSIVLGGHYPLAAIPWDQIAQARHQLASVASATN